MTYRFLAACLHEAQLAEATPETLSLLAAEGRELPPPAPAADVVHPVPDAVMRAWARSAGLPVSSRGRVHPDLRRAYAEAHPQP